MSVKGIDVSSYQGKPNWAEVRKSGVEFAILRILNSKGKDTSFEHNYSGCEAAGICRGVYRFSYALSAAQAGKEAREVVEALAGRKLEMGVWLDLEWSRQRALGSAKVKEIASAWMKVIRDAGYDCNIYCNTDWYKNICSGLNAKYWIARYPAGDNGTMKESLRPNVGEVGWQYSSKGKVPGISGNVDMDIWYGNTVTEPTPEPVEPGFSRWDTDAVRSLQEALNADGIRDANGRELKVDGIRGDMTSSAVERVLLKAGAFEQSKIFCRKHRAGCEMVADAVKYRYRGSDHGIAGIWTSSGWKIWRGYSVGGWPASRILWVEDGLYCGHEDSDRVTQSMRKF